MRFSLLILALAACTNDDTEIDSDGTEVDTEADVEPDTDPDTTVEGDEVYAFDSMNGTDSSVVYTGQTFRHLLISGMKNEIGDLTARIDVDGYFPEAGDVTTDMNFYLEFDGSIGGAVPVPFSSDPAPLQATYADVANGSTLVGKIAGNDATGQHANWTTAFVGWDQDGVTTPESLIRFWVSELDDLAADRAAGTIPNWPDDTSIGKVFITEDGQDLQQLLQKFLLGSIAYSQGTDDYLDDDIDGKGLLSDNTALAEGKPYTALEHVWDEGFGYFGATRMYGSMTDDQIADDGFRDDNNDGAIDLTTEAIYGHAANAAKRDRGAVVMTDYTEQAWNGFYAGRTLIHDADGALTDAELAQLREHRDDAVDAWERAIAATVVHYINDVLQDMNAMVTDDYSAATHAKHWAELKGFSLSLQFNPRSAISVADFAELQGLIGTAPALEMAQTTAAAADLVAARAVLATSYGFDAANLGDSDGENGW
ncbi:MAG: hypothetical protein ACJAZO_004768 [Myxococcota bacterium]|jgi:hypothetical protein